MGPKVKRKILKEKKQEQKKFLARERQRRRRARLIGIDIKPNESTSEASGSQETFKETPEEMSAELEIKEEFSSGEEEESVPEELPESEVLPGPKGQKLFYDGVGYYYTELYEDVTYRWLQCSHGECKVLARMRHHDKAPVELVDQASGHKHQPNPARRHRIMFLHNIKTRHANETLPFNLIFQQESYRNPIGASFFSIEKIQAHMQKKISLGRTDSLSQESMLSATSKLSMISSPAPELEPPSKKLKIDNNPTASENRSKKIEQLKSLKSLSVTEFESNEAAVIKTSKPLDRIPEGPSQTNFFLDGAGNVYKPIAISDNCRYLKCVTKGCQARAVMGLKGLEITPETDSPAHNHSNQGQFHRSTSPSVTIQPVNLSSCDMQEKENQVDTGTEYQNAMSPMVVLNKFSINDKKKNYEKLEGPEYYYDLKGYYYFSNTTVHNNKRFLRCLNPTCLAQAMIRLDGEGEIELMTGSRPHNHAAEINTNYKKLLQWEDHWKDSLPSERLPSLSIRLCCYHDGRGYYYYQSTQNINIRYLVCVEPKCPVRAHMSMVKDAPITISGLRMGHNHRPDYTLREALLFVDAVRVRARSENISPENAVILEAVRNPVGAERVDLNQLKLCLKQVAELGNNKSKNEMVEDEVDFESCVKRYYNNTPQKTCSALSQVPVPNHFNSPQPRLDVSTSEEEKYLKGELVPALLSDSWMYHDGNGYYYKTRNISDGYRYLQCVLPKCGVLAVVGQEGGPVKLRQPHSHGPQPPQHQSELWFFHRIKVRAQKHPDTPMAQIYKEIAEKDPVGAALVSQAETEQLMEKYLISVIKCGIANYSKPPFKETEALPAETLHLSSAHYQYHDGKGYYYVVDTIIKRSGIMSLRCSYQVSCPARATLEDGKVKRLVHTRHNHKPDLVHRDICIFSQALKTRTRDETTPISVIYNEEAKRYPKAAAVLKEESIKEKLVSLRRYVWREVSIHAEGDVEDSVDHTNQSRPYVASEMFTGKTKNVHHDGRGNYYQQTFTTNQMRYLMCCEPHCLAQAKMGLMAGSPVELVGASRHCHAPDPLRRNLLRLVHNVKQKASQLSLQPDAIYQMETSKEPVVAAQIPKEFLLRVINDVRLRGKKDVSRTTDKDDYENDTLWRLSEAGERLPSEHGWLYHNHKGYFYYSHDTDKSLARVLRCCEKGCDATVHLQGDQLVRAPGSLLHNHAPDPRRLSMVLLLHRVATRVQVELASVADIYMEEAVMYPEGAALIPKNKLNEILQTLTVRKYFKELEEEELAQKEITSVEHFKTDHVLVEPCEILPSLSLDKPTYHDSEGHFYTDLLKDKERKYVKCVMPTCAARGYIEPLEPWKLHVPQVWREHNHSTDPQFRDRLLFVYKLKKRAMKEDTPVDVIYREESAKEPLSADLVNEAYLKNLLHKVRKSQNVGDKFETFPYEDISSTECVTNNAFRIPESTQVEHAKPPTNKPVVQIKVESVSSMGVDGDYEEDEYLEEERLEEEFPDGNSQNETCREPARPEAVNGSTLNVNRICLQMDGAPLPSEKLPFRQNSYVFHNGKGYYYQVLSVKDGIMHLKCSEPGCKARGIKASREEAPITPTHTYLSHNHPADLQKRACLMFVQQCKDRAAAETNLSINNIWESQVSRDPVSASQVNAANIKTQMIKYRLEKAEKSDALLPSKEPSEYLTPQSSVEETISHDSSMTSPVKEKEHEDIHEGAVPEKIPSLSGDTLWYAAGYFYSTQSTTGSVKKVKCVERECIARALVALGDRGQPLSINLVKSTAHCHEADLQRKEQMLFIDRCKKRARTTLQSVEEIYYDEACKCPDVASQLSAVRVKRAMGIAKKEGMKKGNRSGEIIGMFGDHGMTELGQMAKVPVFPSIVVQQEESTVGAESEGQDDGDDYLPEETLVDTLDPWIIDPHTLTPQEKLQRKKALARDRQRRRRTRLVEDPERWDQLERDREMSRQRALQWQRQRKMRSADKKMPSTFDSGVKPSPLLGPKFLKELVNSEQPEEEESVEHSYSDYVTLEEELDYNETEPPPSEEVYEAAAESSVHDESQEEGTVEFEQETTENTKPYLVRGNDDNTCVYHDGNGFFYDTIKIADGYRYLKCAVEGCRVRGFMKVKKDGAPIILNRDSPAHSHDPDSSHQPLVQFVQRCEHRARQEEETLVEDILDEEAAKDPDSASKLITDDLLKKMAKIRRGYSENETDSEKEYLSTVEDSPENEETMSESDKDNFITVQHKACKGRRPTLKKFKKLSSEVLPGDRPNTTIYHDMNGYYFMFNALRENKRYLKCIEPLCKVRGWMTVDEGSPIFTNPKTIHNHRPDFTQRNFVLFLRNCKARAAEEDVPLRQIYEEESKKDPISATMISARNLLQRMQRVRQRNMSFLPTNTDEDEFIKACTSNTISTDVPPHELVEEYEEEENQISQGNDYEDIVAEAVLEDSEQIDEEAESDVLDKAMSQFTSDASSSKQAPFVEGAPVPKDQLLPSEVLPGLRPSTTTYHDGRGYYYLSNHPSDRTRYLRCVVPQCRARAHMDLADGSPIIQTSNHDHRPDVKRKQFVLWLENLKHRAATDTLPIPTIYTQEAARDPESASRVPLETIRTRLYRTRKLYQTKELLEQREFEGERDNGGGMAEISENTAAGGNLDYVYKANELISQQHIYVDDQGFCYQQSRVRNFLRYLKCIVPECKAKASMGLEDNAPITLSKHASYHCHSVDQGQLAVLLDPSAADATIQVVYTEEEAGEQVTLCHIPEDAEQQEQPKPTKSPWKNRKKLELTIDPEEPPTPANEFIVEEQDTEEEFYHNEDQQKYPLRPSEVIPGLRPDANNYHDGNGFYYELNRLSQNIRYLKCLIKDCKARAYMELGKENAPIIQTNFAKHSHGPDLSRKRFTVFLHRVTRRAAEEDTPINVIYQQEAERDPISAQQIRMENVKQRMMRFRKKHRQEKMLSQEESLMEADMDESMYNVEDGNQVLHEQKGERMQGEEEELLYDSYVVSEVEVESQQ